MTEDDYGQLAADYDDAEEALGHAQATIKRQAAELLALRETRAALVRADIEIRRLRAALRGRL